MKTNLSVGEVAILTELMKTHKVEFFGKLLPSLAKQNIENLWKEAAKSVSPVGFKASSR